jgi:hypothetical protein
VRALLAQAVIEGDRTHEFEGKSDISESAWTCPYFEFILPLLASFDPALFVSDFLV